jgi:hypothetical protein
MILGIASPGGGRNDVGDRGGRVRMWLAHLAGGLFGGGSAATLVWILASPVRTLPPHAATVSAFAGAVAFFTAWDLIKFRLPFRGRQVPATWKSAYGATRSYGMYGAFLGAGLLTYVSVGATYVLYCGLALMSDLTTAAAAGAIYGVARAGLVGPAALSVETSSKLLYRSKYSQPALSIVSAFASSGLLLQGMHL